VQLNQREKGKRVRLLDKVREFLQGTRALAHDGTGAQADLELRAATAVLLLEAAYGDESYVWREHRTIVKGLEREFGIGKQETLELLGQANEIRPPVVTLAEVTEVIRDRFGKEQRQQVLQLLWRVIETDGAVAEWEEAFADHVARAVGLSEDDARASRRSARQG
jgi:uncharacterized tellurite resistance protein B-like protein